jgi:hypothetical protein
MISRARVLVAQLNRGAWLPRRVMINEFEGRSPVAGMPIDVIFVRDDGWTLGAPSHLEAAAARTWADRWAYRLRRTSDRGWVIDDDLMTFVARGLAAQRAVNALTPTYEITDREIHCRLCGSVSFSPDDRVNRYCGRCHLSHDLVAQARRMVASGGSHECSDWRTARGECALCQQGRNAT